jgi:hypothetical protein
MAYKRSTLEELYHKNMFPYKVWYILLEDVNYTADNIFNISHKISLEPFYSDNLMELWEMGDYQIEKRMMYNMKFLEELEEFLIKNGIYFNWIKYKEEYIGIRIQPSLIDFNGILKDCMTFKEFSWNRQSYMFIDNKNHDS